MDMRKFAASGGVLLLLVLVSGLFLAKPSDGQIGQGVPKEITPSPTPKTNYNFLLLGKGGEGHEGGNLTDTMQLVQVDTLKRIVVMVNIPRDLWVEFETEQDWQPDQTKQMDQSQQTGQVKQLVAKKINHVYWLGGENELKRLIGNITGVMPENFMLIDFAGFVRIVNVLGGIDVDVPAAFVDELYPIKGKENDTCGKSEDEMKALVATLSGTMVDRQLMCRYERLEFAKGRTKMDGETALKFVRSRHSSVEGGDFARSQRQQAVIKAVINKTVSLGTLSKIGSLRTEAASIVKTDFDLESVWTFMPMLPELGSYKLFGFVLSTDNALKEAMSPDRQYILLPKDASRGWQGVRDYIATESARIVENSLE